MDFQPFPKIARIFKHDIVITEKLDGTNAQVSIEQTGSIPVIKSESVCYIQNDIGSFEIRAGSRNKWIHPKQDNYGFANWVWSNAEELVRLGPGNHFGEWWGNGIQRNYSQTKKNFSLFNVSKWSEDRPKCCDVVPVLYKGVFHTEIVKKCLRDLEKTGSVASPGFMKPEGIIIFHEASGHLYKYTIDDSYKGEK